MFDRLKRRKPTHADTRVGPTTEQQPVTESSGLETQQLRHRTHPLGDSEPGPKLSLRFVLKRTYREFSADNGSDAAAGLTYYSVQSLFPAAIALLSILGLIGQGQNAIDTIMNIINPLITSTNTQGDIRDVLESLATARGAGIGLAVGILGALFSASGYLGAFSRAMNKIYEVPEGRPFYKMRPMQLALTVVIVLLSAAALVILVVSGPLTDTVGQALGVGDGLQTVWNVAKWPALLVLVVMIVDLLYWATPNVRFERFRLLSVGAFVAIVILVLATVGFAFYVTNFGSYNKTYGTFAGVIIGLLWLYLVNTALLLGAELDTELERRRQLDRGIAAEHVLQLPLRDRGGVEKADRALEKDLETMRKVRLAAAGSGDPDDRPFDKR